MTSSLAQARADFPILQTCVNGRRLVYLDSAASAQKPRAVLDAMTAFYEHDYANIHRGAYDLSLRATDLYEGARAKVQAFLGAEAPEEIVFTKGATEAINLVASSWGLTHLKSGDEILLTTLEHHANIVPWQLIRERTGITLRVVPITPEGDVRGEDVCAAMTPRTRLVALAHVSNVLGTVLPVREVAALAHAQGALVLVDGCQAVAHVPVNVRDLGADFYVFSGHKIYGPTGIGVLYARCDVLEAMPPYQGGGDMVERVTWEKTTFKAPPARFEAGTPPIAEAIGLAAALDYVQGFGFDILTPHDQALVRLAHERLTAIPGVRLFGTAAHKAAVVSFGLDGVHPHDLATVLDSEGVAIRAGHHCAQPLMQVLGVPATARASFALTTTEDDIAALESAVRKAKDLFA